MMFAQVSPHTRALLLPILCLVMLSTRAHGLHFTNANLTVNHVIDRHGLSVLHRYSRASADGSLNLFDKASYPVHLTIAFGALPPLPPTALPNASAGTLETLIVGGLLPDGYTIEKYLWELNGAYDVVLIMALSDTPGEDDGKSEMPWDCHDLSVPCPRLALSIGIQAIMGAGGALWNTADMELTAEFDVDTYSEYWHFFITSGRYGFAVLWLLIFIAASLLVVHKWVAFGQRIRFCGTPNAITGRSNNQSMVLCFPKGSKRRDFQIMSWISIYSLLIGRFLTLIFAILTLSHSENVSGAVIEFLGSFGVPFNAITLILVGGMMTSIATGKLSHTHRVPLWTKITSGVLTLVLLVMSVMMLILQLSYVNSTIAWTGYYFLFYIAVQCVVMIYFGVSLWRLAMQLDEGNDDSIRKAGRIRRSVILNGLATIMTTVAFSMYYVKAVQDSPVFLHIVNTMIALSILFNTYAQLESFKGVVHFRRLAKWDWEPTTTKTQSSFARTTTGKNLNQSGAVSTTANMRRPTIDTDRRTDVEDAVSVNEQYASDDDDTATISSTISSSDSTSARRD